MPKRRDLIRMTAGEIEAFLAARRTMHVATHNRDGTIHLVAMWYGFLPGGGAGFATFSRSQKVRNLQRDPRISALVQAGELYEELRGVQLSGTAEVTQDESVLLPLARSVVGRYLVLADPEEEAAAVEGLARNRAAVLINVDKVVSWDHTKLGGTY
jgi:PPOX class probable F420-dependent enzyme